VPEILIPLDHLGRLIGHLDLGARRNRRPYSLNDRNLLLQTANAVATAIALANVKNAYIQKTS
jgi:GAF domain-containing protein